MPNPHPARGVKGFFLRMPTGEFVFRVYGEADQDGRPSFTDYQIRHCDLEVEIITDYAVFDEVKRTLDYPGRKR